MKINHLEKILIALESIYTDDEIYLCRESLKILEKNNLNFIEQLWIETSSEYLGLYCSCRNITYEIDSCNRDKELKFTRISKMINEGDILSISDF